MSGREQMNLVGLPPQTPESAARDRDASARDAGIHFAAAFAEQARIIQEQTAYIARYKKMYDLSSARAKIGVWECELSTETLTWTDGVYDIFELPRGSDVSRAMSLALYDEESRITMSRLRQKAIEDCGSFQLDIRIRTAKGNDRWVRLSADIECEDGCALRIFGLKQDITQEKEATERMRVLAESDSLTGLANRSVFETKIESLLTTMHPAPLAALVLVDLDGFKQINDTFGHAAGDECLKQVAARIRMACGRDDVAARIGGDEFAILLTGARDRTLIEARVARILAEVQPSIVWEAHAFNIGASFGIAIPRDAQASSPAMLFNEADFALYAAKNGGGNAFQTFDPKARPETGLQRPLANEPKPSFV